MKRKTGISSSAPAYRVERLSLGSAKAAKFALVEGLSLDSSSLDLLQRSKAAGLKGDALRAAIAGSFLKNSKLNVTSED